MKKFLNSSKGISLVEVLVVVALMSVIGLGMATMMKNMLSAQKGVEQKSNVLMLHSEVFRTLNNSNACFNTFVSADVYDMTPPSTTTVSPTAILNADSVAVFNTTLTYYNNTIKINSITLQEYVPDSAANAYFGTARVVVVYEKVGTNIGLERYTRDFRISLVLRRTGEQFQGAAVLAADDGKIRTCAAVSGTNINDNYWTQIAGQNAISYQFNVGVGSGALPAGRLEVSDIGNTANRGLINSQYSNTPAASSYLGLNRARGTLGAATAVVAGDPIGDISFRGHDGTGFGTGASIQAFAAENYGAAAKGTSLLLSTVPAGTVVQSPRMSILSNGNVGIGAVVPTSKLVVSDSVGPLPADLSSNVASFTGVDGASTRLTVSSFGPGNTAPLISFRKSRGTAAAPTALQAGDNMGLLNFVGYGSTGFGASGRSAIGSFAAESWTDAAQGTLLTFLTTPVGTTLVSERMRIDSLGRTSIGTTDAAYTLTVAPGGTGSGLSVGWNQDGASGQTDFYNYGQAGAGGFQFWNYPTPGVAYPTIGAVNLMTLLGSGSVGIGTSAPQFAFHVKTPANMTAGLFESTNIGNASAIGFKDPTTTSRPQIGSKGDDLFLQTNGIERIRILSASGAVGIGTTAPTQALHVVGSVEVSANIHAVGTITANSDVRLKKNIISMGSVLRKILLLNPVYFQWNVGDDRRFIGFKAQEVQTIFPELVETNPDGYLSVNYMQMTAPIVGAIKELDENNKVQDQEIANLKKENQELREEIAEIKRILKRSQL